MFYYFEIDHNAADATKNMCCVEGEGPINQCTVISGLKKFCLRHQNLDEQVKSDSPKIVDSKAVLWAIEENWACITRRVSCEIGISVHCDSSTL